MENGAKHSTPDDILSYERFITTVLEPTLKDLQAQSMALEVTITSCTELLKLLKDNKETGEGALEILVDMGERCMMQGIITNPVSIKVDTGVMGFIIEMSRAEAIIFVRKRIHVLRSKVKVKESRAEAVIDDISHARSLLDDLQTLSLH
jgi:prefoldin subunit 5